MSDLVDDMMAVRGLIRCDAEGCGFEILDVARNWIGKTCPRCNSLLLDGLSVTALSVVQGLVNAGLVTQSPDADGVTIVVDTARKASHED